MGETGETFESAGDERTTTFFALHLFPSPFSLLPSPPLPLINPLSPPPSLPSRSRFQDLLTTKLLPSVLDRFFISHLVGFAALGYCVRSRACCVAISVGFEMVEVSLKSWLPNFNEW